MRTMLAVLVLLGGCATPGPDPRDAEFARHSDWVQEQIGAGKMSRRDGAISARDKSRELGIADGYTEEVWAYRVMIGGQVDRGEITPDQAAYLDQQKVNDVLRRVSASAPPPPKPIFSPAVTCKPDGYGGMRCR